LTAPAIILSTTSLKFETNAIHDNGATVSLCSKEVADAIGHTGEQRPVGLAVFGNNSQVTQAFKTMIALEDSSVTHVGNALIYVIPEFVKYPLLLHA
jgi:hypothetical protein